nr:M60 family metallopeptidase [Anaerotignum lactatifermentans]
MLELSNWYQISEKDRKDAIQTYVDEVSAYVQKKGSTLNQTSIWNQTEISTPSVLLSIPVKEAANGLTVDSLYDAILAWEDVSYVVNTTQGIVDTAKEDYQYPMESRQNIRYMRMFGSAFMYAAGNHIGVGYTSAGELTKGQPVTKLAQEAESNGLYGWGIAHEIGHNMDKLGKTEITNNLYSLMVQSYDGKDMTSLPTRLETEGKYDDIFQKTAEARPGSANNVFVQLGMYWQLHLAYDDASEPMAFYQEFFQLWKSGEYASGNDYDNRFALIASKVADRDLTEFFTRWGMELSESTKRTLKTYEEETRAIWYLNDDSRRNRLDDKGKANGTLTLEPVSITDSADGSGQDVTLRFSHTDSENILGYEILRDGKSIAFTQKTTYTDQIGTANNTVLTYSVRAIDKQGNPSADAEEQQVRISYDNVLEADLYELSREGTTITITMKDGKAQSVAGIKLDQTTSSVTAHISTNADDNQKETTLILSQNMSDEGKFKAYFTKPGANETDSRIWTYDATKIVLEHVPEGAAVQLIGAVNDDVAFHMDGASIGRLSHNFQWGDTSDEVIPAGSLVIVGTYVGDPRYNYVEIQGEFTVRDLETGTESKEIRPINGETYLLAEIPEDGQVSLISNGMFLYVIDEDMEDSLKGDHVDCDQPSSLPDRIQALLYRTDSISSTNGRVTAKTVWITSPDADSLPSIVLEQN